MATNAFAARVCKTRTYGNESIKICADVEYARDLGKGYEFSQELSNITPDIATKIDGFTILSGQKQVAWELCDLFDILSDGISVLTLKSDKDALSILPGKNEGRVTPAGKKGHRIVESVICHEMY